MRIVVPHFTSKTEARRIIEQKMAELLKQYGHYATDLQHAWEGDVLNFSLKARGFNVGGTLEVSDHEVALDGKVPLIAKPFEPRIRSTVEREAGELFRKA